MRSLWLVALLGTGCGSSPDAGTPDAADDLPQVTCDELEAQMRTTLDGAALDPTITRDPNFTLLIEAEDGRRFTHSYGTSTPDTVYESASTSKWVTAVAILDLVERGLMTLDMGAHEVMPAYWLERKVTLRSLLAFTSGFGKEAACLNLGAANYAQCVRTLYQDNVLTAKDPGVEFEYGATHMQIAGAMAIAASGKQSWAEVFSEWKTAKAMFPTGVYDLPSLSNPRLAAGMHWNGEEYLGFLRALYKGELLQPATMAELHGDQRGAASVVYSPVYDLLGEDWSYGLGNWIECPTAKTPGGFDCTGLHRNSSAGAYGSYPFIDFDHAYFGLVARQGDLMSADEGIAIFRSVESAANQWADRRCD